MNLPFISLKQLQANLTRSAYDSAVRLLSDSTTTGLLVVENQDILSPAKGRKSVLAFGINIPTRKTLEEAVSATQHQKEETPVAVIDRETVRAAIAGEACTEIKNLCSIRNAGPELLTELKQVVQKAEAEIARFG